jgi:hypothetical protein
MPAQPGGHRFERGATATLMAGVNPAAAPARHSHSCLALAVSAAAGVRSVPTNNDRTETEAAVTPGEHARSGSREQKSREAADRVWGPGRLAARWQSGTELYRETGDVDLGDAYVAQFAAFAGSVRTGPTPGPTPGPTGEDARAALATALAAIRSVETGGPVRLSEIEKE